MINCEYCGEKLYGGDFDDYGLHDECAREVANQYPQDGDTCNICGGNIMNTHAIGYEQYYMCNTCLKQWTYD